MPLDHYVPQVHLRNFYSPALNGKKMFGMRKRDGTKFPCASKDVCRREDGSTNPFIEPNRIVEDFLKTVEPRYNAALAALQADQFSEEHIYVVAGYAAYVTTATPTALRVAADPFKHIVHSTVEILERQGQLPPVPTELGDFSLTDLVRSGKVFAKVDPQYPQSIGIAQLLDKTGIWGNCRWDLIWNDFPESPFFTSDTAFSIEQSNDPKIVNRIFPLSPKFAIRILPDYGAKNFRGDLNFSRFRYRKQKPSRSQISMINKSIVQCAENLLFFRDDLPWIEEFVDKYRDYWIAPTAHQVPVMGGGIMNVFGLRIDQRSQAN